MTALHTAARAAIETAPALIAHELSQLLAPMSDDQAAIAQAVDTSDELELDDEMFAGDFSAGDEGCWVRAWVFVPYSDVPELCTECHEFAANGEGEDGLCGNCADKKENENEPS